MGKLVHVWVSLSGRSLHAFGGILWKDRLRYSERDSILSKVTLIDETPRYATGNKDHTRMYICAYVFAYVYIISFCFQLCGCLVLCSYIGTPALISLVGYGVEKRSKRVRDTTTEVQCGAHLIVQGVIPDLTRIYVYRWICMRVCIFNSLCFLAVHM